MLTIAHDAKLNFKNMRRNACRCHNLSLWYTMSRDARLHSNRLGFLVIPGFLLSRWLEGC